MVKNTETDFYTQKGIKPNSFVFSKVSEAVVLRMLSELNPTKGTGLDHLPARFQMQWK